MKSVIISLFSFYFCLGIVFSQKKDFVNAPKNPVNEDSYLSRNINDKYAIVNFEIFNEDGSLWGTQSAKRNTELISRDEAKAKNTTYKSYNSDGFLTETTLYTKDKIYRTVYKYNQRGLIISSETSSQKTTYEYDSTGRVIKMKFVDNDGKESITNYRYLKEGDVLKIFTEKSGDYGNDSTESHYKNGLEIFNKPGKDKPGFKNKYTFDSRGSWITHQNKENPSKYYGLTERSIIYWDEIQNPTFEVKSEIIDPQYGSATSPYSFINGKKAKIPWSRATGNTYISYIPQSKTYYAAIDAYSKSNNIAGTKHQASKISEGSEVMLFQHNGYFNILHNGKKLEGESDFSNVYGTLVYHIENTKNTYIIPNYGGNTNKGVPGYLDVEHEVFYIRDLKNDNIHIIDKGNLIDYSKVDSAVKYTEQGDPIRIYDGKPTYILTDYNNAKDRIVYGAKRYTSEKIYNTNPKVVNETTTKEKIEEGTDLYLEMVGDNTFKLSQNGTYLAEDFEIIRANTKNFSVAVLIPSIEQIFYYSTKTSTLPLNQNVKLKKLENFKGVAVLFSDNNGYSYLTPSKELYFKSGDYLHEVNKGKGTATITLKSNNKFYTGPSSRPGDTFIVSMREGKELNDLNKNIAEKTITCSYGNCENGYGVATDKDNNQLNGLFNSEGKLSGPGYRTYGKQSYYGNLKNNFRDGYGKYIWEPKTYHLGTWRNGNQDGYGYYVKDNKITSGGFYEDGKLKTELTKDFNANVKTGDCTGNCANGFGSYTYSNGASYFGFWKNSSPNHVGSYYFKGGDSYAGEILNGKRSGIGTFIWKNGDYYIGDWSNDQQHGYGIYYYANGEIKEGNWTNGKL